MKVNPSILGQFKNRQVIINHYVDEELIKRDGFHFDRVDISENKISIIRNDLPLWSLNISNFAFQPGNSFKNFFRLLEGDVEIQIYFP